jgi:hypothetical protein
VSRCTCHRCASDRLARLTLAFTEAAEAYANLRDGWGYLHSDEERFRDAFIDTYRSLVRARYDAASSDDARELARARARGRLSATARGALGGARG